MKAYVFPEICVELYSAEDILTESVGYGNSIRFGDLYVDDAGIGE